MASHGGAPMTPARAEGNDVHSPVPATERSIMPAMPDPQDTQGAEMLMLRNYVAELAGRHNTFVVDATTEFHNTHAKFQEVNAWSIGTDDKLGLVEKAMMSHDNDFGLVEKSLMDHNQRILSNESWVQAVSRDFTQEMPLVYKKAEALAEQVRLEVKGLEDRLGDFNDNVRAGVMDCLNLELVP